MNISIRNVLSVTSALLLVIIIALAGTAWNTISKLQLPIPSVFAALVTFLPLVNYAFLAISSRPRGERGGRLGFSSLPVLLFVWILLLGADVLIVTLSSTYLSPSSNACPLQGQWDHFWKTKDGNAISSIQNQLQCCGFHSLVDRPYPFPSKTIDLKTCQNLLGGTAYCFPRWQEKMGMSGGLLASVGVVLFVVKVIMLLAFSSRPGAMENFMKSYTSSSSRIIEEEEDGNGTGRLIEPYLDDEGVNGGGTIAVASRESRGDSARLLPDRSDSVRLLPDREESTHGNSNENGGVQAPSTEDVWRD